MPERNLKQIKIGDDIHSYLKELAKANQTSLQKFTEGIIHDFVKRRICDQTADSAYLNSPQNGSYKSFWLNKSLILQIKELAQRDSTSENRVIYTSMFHFYSDQKNDTN